MSGKISTGSKHQLTIEEELFQAADKKIAELNKLGVAQGRTDISEPERQHLPVLVDFGDFENWLKDAEPYVIDKRLKRNEKRKFGGKKIEVKDILKDITVRDKLAKKCHSVMVLAPAGMGKTTLLRRIAQNVRRGEYKELKDKLVLMLDFRPYLKEKKIIPSQVLLGDMFSDWGSERMKQRYQWIVDNPEKVVFVIDSLDTLPFDLGKKASPRLSNRPEYHKAATADVILRSIFAKDWFAETIIISSSREYKVRNLHPSFRPDRCILLDGLTEESVQDLIDGFLGKVRGEEVKNYITTECPDVWPLLSIPVVLVFSIIGFVEDGFKPKTLSGILIKFFQSLIRSSHAHVENVLIVFNKLLPLAFEGTRSLCVLFTPEYLKTFGLEPEEVEDLGALIPQSHGTFLSTKLMQNDGFLLYFNHQTQQEALAALHVMSLFLAEFKTFMEGEVWEQQFTVVRRLIFGTLLNDEVLEAAQELTEISDVDQKKKILIRSLDVALEKYQQDGYKTKLLELFIDLSECREEGVTELIRSSVKKIDLSQTALSPSDVQAVAFMMKQCEYLEEVNLMLCHLNDEKMKNLSKTIEQSNVKLNIFEVSSNDDLGVEGAHLLGKLVRNHEVEGLGADGGSIQGCEALKKFIEGLGDAKLNKFDVSYNQKLGVEGAHLLGKLVRNHEVEDLDASGESIQGCEALKKFIEGLGDAKLNKFDVSYNQKLGVEGAHLLGKLVRNHEVEDLDASGESIQGCEALKKFIEGLGDAKIDHLNLSGCDVECPQPLIRSLLDLLPHVENKLNLMGWKINESQQQELQQKLNEIGSPSLEVVISGIEDHTTLKASLMDSTSETSDEASTSGTAIAIPSGASLAPAQSVHITKPESTTSEKEEAGGGAVETDLLDENSVPGTSVTADESTQSQKEAEQDNAAGSVVGDERIQTESAGVSHLAASERNPVIQIPCLTTQEEFISRARGGKIKSGNCKVKFSSGLLKHDAKIKITVKSGLTVLDRPKQGIPISPTLGCDLSHVGLVPGSEMKVEMRAYCFASKPVPITLLSKSSDSEDWEIEKELMLGRDRKVKFKTSSFSHKVLVFMRRVGLGKFLNFVVIPQLYYDELGSFSSYLSVGDKSIIDEIETAHFSAGFASALVKPEKIHAKLGEIIRLKLQCEHPQTATFGLFGDNEDQCASDELIDKTYVKKDFTLSGITDQVDRGFIEIHFALAIEPPPQRPLNPMKRRLKWPMISTGNDKEVTVVCCAGRLSRRWPNTYTPPAVVQHQRTTNIITAKNVNYGQMEATDSGAMNRITSESQTGNEASEQNVEQGGATSSVTARTYNKGRVTRNEHDTTTQVFSKSTKD